MYFNSVGESVDDGSVGMAVGGSGVGKGTAVSKGFTGSAMVVLTSAVTIIGVDSPLPAGMIGAQAVRNTTKRMVKVVRVFISDSFSLGLV